MAGWVELTSKEYDILQYFPAPGKVLDVRSVYEGAWGEKYMPTSTNTVMVHILNLRKKLEEDPTNPKLIRTIWGKGVSIWLKGKPYRRLSLKLLAMLLLAAMAAIALGLTLQVLGDYLVERVYCSEKRQNLRLLEAIGSFRTYVQEEAVSSTNVQKIGVWNHSHPYIQLTVSANGAILNSDRWGAEMVGSDGGFVIRSGKNQEKISSSANSAEHTFPVNFTDGSYQVEIQDFSQNQLYALVSWASLAAGGIIFLALMLLYNSQVTSLHQPPGQAGPAGEQRRPDPGNHPLLQRRNRRPGRGCGRYAPVHHGQAPAGRARMASQYGAHHRHFP